MSEKDSHSSPPGFGVLVSEIIEDAQKLIRQEIDLARSEIDTEWKKFKAAVAARAMIVVMLGAGVVLLGQTLAYLISELTSAPLWFGYAVMTLIFFSVGFILALVSKKKTEEINVLPKQTLKSIKENITWIRKQA